MEGGTELSLSDHQFIGLSDHQSVCLSDHQSVCLSDHQCVCLSDQSLWHSLYLFISISLCLSGIVFIYLSRSFSLSLPQPSLFLSHSLYSTCLLSLPQSFLFSVTPSIYLTHSCGRPMTSVKEHGVIVRWRKENRSLKRTSTESCQRASLENMSLKRVR